MKLLKILPLIIALLVFSCKPISSEQNSQESKKQEKYYTFQVLYPQPTITEITITTVKYRFTKPKLSTSIF